MKISLIDAGKRYNREWIFRQLNLEFLTGNSYAITGANGSGKSTLLQVIAGSLILNEGKIIINDQPATDDAFKLVSLAAPYLELIEEMTGAEFLEFHSKFKPFLNNWDANTILQKVELDQAAHKQIRNYSSGMKQRIKLAQCILSNCPFILLDEPCTNLDEKGIVLYHHLIETYTKERCVMVSSNDKTEFSFCQEKIDIQEFKKTSAL